MSNHLGSHARLKSLPGSRDDPRFACLGHRPEAPNRHSHEALDPIPSIDPRWGPHPAIGFSPAPRVIHTQIKP